MSMRKWYIPQVLRQKSDDELKAFLDEATRKEKTTHPESRSVYRDMRIGAEREQRRRAKKAEREAPDSN